MTAWSHHLARKSRSWLTKSSVPGYRRGFPRAAQRLHVQVVGRLVQHQRLTMGKQLGQQQAFASPPDARDRRPSALGVNRVLQVADHVLFLPPTSTNSRFGDFRSRSSPRAASRGMVEVGDLQVAASAHLPSVAAVRQAGLAAGLPLPLGPIRPMLWPEDLWSKRRPTAPAAVIERHGLGLDDLLARVFSWAKSMPRCRSGRGAANARCAAP